MHWSRVFFSNDLSNWWGPHFFVYYFNCFFLMLIITCRLWVIYFLVVCAMCFDRFITILLQKSLKLSAMIRGSLVWMLEMLGTEYSGFGYQYRACWCPGLSCQGISRHGIDSIGYATCGVAPLEIWSSSVEQNPTYDMKYEFIYYNLKTIQR